MRRGVEHRLLQAIMAEAEADVASQARTEAELRKMLAETTDRCSRLQWQSEMADRRLDLIRHNSTDAPGGSASRPQSAKATSPKVFRRCGIPWFDSNGFSARGPRQLVVTWRRVREAEVVGAMLIAMGCGDLQGQLEEVQKELKAAKERGDQQDKLLIRSARRITALEGENSALKVALQAVRVRVCLCVSSDAFLCHRKAYTVSTSMFSTCPVMRQERTKVHSADEVGLDCPQVQTGDVVCR
jgi:hypothetical protein